MVWSGDIAKPVRVIDLKNLGRRGKAISLILDENKII